MAPKPGKKDAFQQMFEDLRTGNHSGGILTLQGLMNVEEYGKYLEEKEGTASNAATGKKTSSGSKGGASKRPHSAITDEEDKENEPEEIDDDHPLVGHFTDDCDQIRRKINTFINNGGMGVVEFQDAIGVAASSYHAFMKQKGKDAGMNNATYDGAGKFFKKRELQGLKMPRKKAAKKASASAGSDGKDPYDVSGIHLDDEDEGKVEIYETCDSLRRMVAAHLRKDGVTQASFLREVSKQFGNDPKKMTSAQLQAFQRQRGPRAGSSAGFFYGAYVYLEKLRIKQGKPKSAFRKDMEDFWENEGGFPREGNRGAFICFDTETIYEDKYGKLHIQRR